MAGRPTEAVSQAVAWVLAQKGTPAQAASRYGCAVRSVQHALAQAGQSKPRGRPRAPGPAP